jgi:Flp pilus assembly protein TadB
MSERPLGRYGTLGLVTAAAVLVAWLLARHLDHVAGFLPPVVLFACLLMHLFMHGRRARRADGGQVSSGRR